MSRRSGRKRGHFPKEPRIWGRGGSARERALPRTQEWHECILQNVFVLQRVIAIKQLISFTASGFLL